MVTGGIGFFSQQSFSSPDMQAQQRRKKKPMNKTEKPTAFYKTHHVVFPEMWLSGVQNTIQNGPVENLLKHNIHLEKDI